MRVATQEDLDNFKASVMFDENIYPFLSTVKYQPEWVASKSDWEYIWLINESGKFLIKLSFDRAVDLEISICLFTKSPFACGKGLREVIEFIKRYKPAAITTGVAESNTKSLRLNRRLLGNEWGIEPNGAWNCLKGQYEGYHRFKLICQK